MNLRLPTLITVALGLVGGVLEFLNQTSFGFAPPWNQVITFGLFALSVVGVSPLVHSAFRNAVHVSPRVATAITVAASLLAAGITTFSMASGVKGALEAVLAFVTFVGFGPNVVTSLALKPKLTKPKLAK